MYNVSQSFLTAIKQLVGRQFKSSVTIRDTTFDDNNIITINLEENVNPTDTFMLGAVGSSKFEVTLINLPNNLILENAQVKSTISLSTGSIFEDVPLGVFWVDDISKDKGTIKLTCFDNMIKLEKPYFSDLNYPTDINNVASEICTKAGVELASALPSIQINKIEGYTYREAVSFIASFLGGFARFNRLGKLEITSYINTGFSVDGNNYSEFKNAESPFTIGSLACKVGDKILTVGSTGNEVQFENPIMTQEQLNNVYNTLKALSYMPYTMNYQGNPALQAGDKITITDEDNNIYPTLLMQHKIEYSGGLGGSASAVGKTQTAQEFNSNGTMKNTIDRMVIEQANIKLALIDKANIKDLTATNARIDNANINIASINTLLAGNLSAANMQAGFITAESGLIANAAIKDAMILNVSADKINAGKINTNLVTIQSNSGNMLISDNTIQIKDASRVRVQIGKDASNDYNMYVWDANGKLMFDATGLHADGIKDKIIRDDMVSDTANINGSKIEKESLVTQINGATTTLKASKIKLDTENQILDIAFTSLKSTVTSQGSTITSQGTAISTIQGQISSKIWQQDITTAINGMQIGVRNLLLGSSNFAGWYASIGNSSGDTHVFALPYDGADRYITPGWDSNKVMIIGKTYTLSCKAKATNPTANATLGMRSNNNTNTFISTLTSEYKTYSITFVCSDVSSYIIFGNNASTSANSIMYIKECKLEEGNKPTDWAPAPEDTDAQITTINTNYSSLTQTVNSISANVSSLQTTTSGLSTRMTSAESQLSIQAGQIDTKVTQTDINNSINNVQIGTKNLITDSESEWVTSILATGNGYYGIYKDKDLTSVFASLLEKQVTFSFDIKVDVAGSVRFYCANGTPRYYFDAKIFENITTTYQRVTYTATIHETVGYTGTSKFEFWGTDSYRHVYIKRFKMEIGNKATDWTQAPEDAQAQIDSATTRITTAESNITQLSNSISLKVSTTDFNSYKTSNDGAVSSLTSRISAAELKITSDAIVSTVRTSSSYVNDLAAKANTSDMGTLITQNASSVKVAIGQIGGNNLIKNGGFEFGTTGWSTNNNPTFLTDQTWQIYQGKTCFIGTNTTNGSGIYQVFSTIVGKKYTVQFMLLVDGTHNVDGTIGIEGKWSVSPKDVMSWTKYTYTFTATSTAHVFIAYANAGGSFFIDNIQVEEGENATAWSPNANELKATYIEANDSGLSVTNGALTVKNDANVVVIDGKYNMHKIIITGFTTITLAPGENSKWATINHNLGYVPAFSAYVYSDFNNVYSPVPYTPLGQNLGTGELILGESVEARISSTKLEFVYIRNNTFINSTFTVNIKYFIYKEVAF